MLSSSACAAGKAKDPERLPTALVICREVENQIVGNRQAACIHSSDPNPCPITDDDIVVYQRGPERHLKTDTIAGAIAQDDVPPEAHVLPAVVEPNGQLRIIVDQVALHHPRKGVSLHGSVLGSCTAKVTIVPHDIEG